MVKKFTINAINAINKAICDCGSTELFKVSEKLEENMERRVVKENRELSTDTEKIGDMIDKKLKKMGLKTILDVRAAILKVERVRI